MIRQSVLFLIMRYTFTDLGYFDPGCEAISARWLNRFWLKRKSRLIHVRGNVFTV